VCFMNFCSCEYQQQSLAHKYKPGWKIKNTVPNKTCLTKKNNFGCYDRWWIFLCTDWFPISQSFLGKENTKSLLCVIFFVFSFYVFFILSFLDRLEETLSEALKSSIVHYFPNYLESKFFIFASFLHPVYDIVWYHRRIFYPAFTHVLFHPDRFFLFFFFICFFNIIYSLFEILVYETIDLRILVN